MGVFRVLPLTLLIVLHQATGDGTTIEVIGAVGRSVTFHGHRLHGDGAFWTFGHVPIATVLPGDPPKVVFSEDKYKTRFTFSENGSSLTISQLRMEDAGAYNLKIQRETSTFTLRVYRELAEPRVTCVAQNCSGSGCLFTLHCTTSGPDLGNVSYGWSVGDQPRGEGPTVLVEDELVPLTCWAWNPVGSRNVTITSPREPCTENTTHSPGTGSQSAGLTWIMIPVLIVVLVLLALVFYCRYQGWQIFCLPAGEATDTGARQELTTVYAQVNHCQKNVSNAMRANSKTPQTPGVETSTTIYSTVKAPAQTDDEKMGNGALGDQEVEEKSIYSCVI